MDYDDKIEVYVGFLDGNDVWFEQELLKKGKVSFDPAEHPPRHLVMVGSEHMKSLCFSYVRCMLPVRCLLSSARAGLEGEPVNSVTFYSTTRPSVREVFKRNCKKAALENPDMSVPSNIDNLIDALLSWKGVHVMQEESMMVKGHQLFTEHRCFNDEFQFSELVHDELKAGNHVFLHKSLQSGGFFYWSFLILPKD